ncbi:PilZ domain-containing protein [Endozoicomonas sp. SM1973]|uniref:PilZ domain-containing protein n=1 Tax=Spartinivicinus marinus TaxID=2994442 RepID=A0A853I002_9GAMM|nr:PilZ domain-containing protein [Spartinivicinus marinus]MCX4030063.1 PilZ domain-containing protein [Spartinivicinus marinus]NYZ64692.1 PilZ domain-containing protein [Spartinivicinus marinus]
MTENIDELLEDTESHEQRVFPRREVKWKAAIKDKQTGQIVRAITINVSEQGALLETDICFKKMQVLPVMIQVIYGSSKLVIYTTAEVRHVVIRKTDFHLGLQFKEIDPKSQKFLARFAERAI